MLSLLKAWISLPAPDDRTSPLAVLCSEPQDPAAPAGLWRSLSATCSLNQLQTHPLLLYCLPLLHPKHWYL